MIMMKRYKKILLTGVLSALSFPYLFILNDTFSQALEKK